MTRQAREKQLQMRCMGLCLGLLFVGFIPAMASPTEPVPEATETETEIIQWKQDTEEVSIEPLEEITVAEPEPAEPELVSLGEFLMTAYCSCYECCAKWSLDRPLDENGNEIVYGASGAKLEAGRSIAVDPDVIPYGTVVIINGHEYVAEDCGGSIKENRIDVYHSDHQLAKEFGEQYAEVFTYGD